MKYLSTTNRLSRAIARVNRRMRVLVALAIAVGIGIAVSAFAPTWLVYLGGMLAAAIVGWLVSEYAPTVVERVAGDGPIRALIGADSGVHSDGWSLLMPRDLAPEDMPEFKERPSAEEVRSWFVRRGAYDAGTSQLRLSLLGGSHETVQITGIHARVIKRQTLPQAVRITYPSAGENRVIAVEFDLDQEQPQALSNGEPYFADYTISLAHREAQEMRIAAQARDAAVEWELELDYAWRGERHVLRLDNDGEPFGTAPTASIERSYIWQWWEMPPSLAPAETLETGGA